MSARKSTSVMVADLIRRINLSYTQNFAMDRLNDAFLWMCQQGAFVWLLKRTTVTVANTGYFDLPVDFDPGKPSYLQGNILLAEIPLKSMEEVYANLHYGDNVQRGSYSCWAIETVLPIVTNQYKGWTVPSQAWPVATETLKFVYHTLAPDALGIGASTYFPTPGQFDPLIIDLAEAEIGRIYKLSGWESALQKAQASFIPLLDLYRTTKLSIMGVLDQERLSKEAALAKAR